MGQQEPAVYNLEFSEDVAFWAEAGEGSRRTLVMPLPDPSRFVAFGVVGPGDTVLFVARGQVREHLGAFLSTMERDAARVELYARVPLPWNVVKRYTSDEPYESHETEGPRNPPVQGLVAYGGGAADGKACLLENRTTSLSSTGLAWPDATSPRHVIIIPATGGDDFIAFGYCLSPSRFVFVARGCLSTELGGFTERMTLAGASVDLCAWPSPSFLELYANNHADALFSPGGSGALPLLANVGPLITAQAL